MVAMMVGVSSCVDANKSNLQKVVRATNLQCPIYTVWGGVVNSVKYDEDKNVVTLEIEAFGIPEGWIEEIPDSVYKAAYVLNMGLDTSDKVMFEDISKAHASLDLIYFWPSNNMTRTFSLSDQDIQYIIHPTLSVMEAKERLLDFQVLMAKAMIANENVDDDDIVCVDVTYDGESVIYTSMVDETKYDFNMMEKSKSDLKAHMLEDRNVITEITPITSLGKKVVYSYKGNQTGKTFEIVITESDYNDKLQ